MPSSDEIRAAIQQYVKAMCDSDIDGIVALYAEDASVEDPVGAEPKRGHAVLREFYGASAPKLWLEIVGPICVAGPRCAVPIRAQLSVGEDTKFEIDVIDVMAFDEDGKITRMQAYWDPAAMRPAN